MNLLSALLSTAWGASVSGSVVGQDGAIISGATVYAINNRRQAAETRTRSSGHYQFDALPNGLYRILALPNDQDLHAARHYPSERAFCNGTPIKVTDSHSDINITLPLGQSISGQLTEQDGSPIAGARLLADNPDVTFSRQTTSAEDGHFLITGLEPGFTWNIQAAKSGFPIQWFGDAYGQGEALWVDPAETPSLGAWPVLDGIGLSGSVEGPEGLISSASVRIYSSGQLVQATTDDQGLYSATGLPPGDAIAWASADGFATTYLPDHDRPTEYVSISEEGEWADDINLFLPTEAILVVQLTGAAPRTEGDLSGIPVVLYNDNQTIGRSAQTDENGFAEFFGLHSGDYTVFAYASDAGHPNDWLRHPDGEAIQIAVQGESDTGPITLELAPAITIEGTIQDDFGHPIADASIIFKPAPASASESNANLPFIVGTSNENGEFALVGVQAGKWTIAAQSNPLCPSDPGHVITYWPDESDPAMAQHFYTTTTTAPETVHLVMARDNDHDAMSDRWEARYGLDLDRDDSTEDPDSDGLNNLTEFRYRTNPQVADVEWFTEQGCACSATDTRSGAFWWALLAVAFSRRRAEAKPRKQARRV